MKRREALKNTFAAAGGTLAVPSIITLLQSCESTPRSSWDPQFLSQSELRFITTIVDRWLPKTETPGALDVKVDVFLDTFFARIFNDEGKAMVRSEIQKINERSNTEKGDDFSELNESDQVALMKKYESETAKFNPGIWGSTVGDQEPVGFYRQLKSMTLWAYFSSETVGKNILSYDPIPGAWKGCIDVAEVGKTWTF